ncbi:MAG TPA: O-antigen ligase family protein, partial [Stellaceae bacterium]|nr:O-antigen ligase family protein [Stellaceae bacterium]
DRGATILAIALWPTLLVIGGAAARWRGAGLFVATALVVLGLPSRAAMLSMLVGLVSLLLSLRMPRPMAATIGAAVVAFGLAFSLGTLDSATISRIHERLPWLQNSALHRLAIWHFGMDRVAERPLLGWGLDASRALPGGEAVIDDPALPKVLIGYGQWMPLHPHNAVLQWRLELGVPGLILCILAILWILWRIAGTETVPIRRRAIGLALAASTLVVALISYGFWQEWWQSSFWLLAALAIAVAPYDARAAAGDAATG